MPDFVLGRLKFKFLGEFDPGFAYIKDDIIRVGGRSYVCTSNHTAAGNFGADSANWELMVDGMRWAGVWATGTVYEINDIVNYSGNARICITRHTSSGAFDSAKFENFTG